MKPAHPARLAWLLVLLSAIFFVTAAHAQPSPPASADATTKSRELRDRANEAMTTGRPEEALRLYREAKALAPDPALLYNEGRALQALARYPEALVVLEQFDAEASADLKTRAGRLTALLDEVRAKVAVLRLSCNVQGARVRLGDRRVGTTPFEPTRVNAGPALLEVSADGYVTHTQEVTLAGGVVETNISVTLEQASKNAGVVAPMTSSTTQDKTTEPPPKKSIFATWWFWTAVGVVATGVGVGIVIATQTEKDPATGTIGTGRIGATAFSF